MPELTADVVILGSGFGGSLTALLLERIGLRPVLIERGTHPRFAIGESSTPIADFVLRDLADQFDLPRLKPLSAFGTWQANYPELVCGLKRGFSYFYHVPRQPFRPRNDHANELLVAASSDDFPADTHWLRSDVDAFLVQEVQAAGIPYFDRADISLSHSQSGWDVAGRRREQPLRVRASFVVDATGGDGGVIETLGIPSDADRLATHSRALYAHFRDVRPWQELLADRNARLQDHPFPCDRAALHHLLDEGWMWQLRFENGVSSAGFVLEGADHPLDGSRSAEDEWVRILARYPSVAAQFYAARLVDPPGELRQTGRMQRLAHKMAGIDWCLLPHTAGFIDPLHSTGIAHTLCGVERLVKLLGRHWGRSSVFNALDGYAATLRKEFNLIDQLVSGCYRARRNFRLFTAFSMLYFAAATTYEHRRQQQPETPAAFLCADDPSFCHVVAELWQQLHELTLVIPVDVSRIAQYERVVARRIVPFNRVGLAKPEAHNMYRYTAAPKKFARADEHK